METPNSHGMQLAGDPTLKTLSDLSAACVIGDVSTTITPPLARAHLVKLILNPDHGAPHLAVFRH